MIILLIATLFSPAVPAAGLVAQDHQHQALDARGKRFMGFDQKSTTHHFILTKDGGRVEVRAKDAADAKSIAQIRDHLRQIAPLFSNGDFTTPGLVHDQKVPGVEGMKAAGKSITYTFEEIDRGGHVRITASTPAALAAVHEFLRFQIKDHGTGDSLIVK
jgi:hypothetical protein